MACRASGRGGSGDGRWQQLSAHAHAPQRTRLERRILGLRARDEVHAVGLRQLQLLLHPRLQAVVLGPLTAAGWGGRKPIGKRCGISNAGAAGVAATTHARPQRHSLEGGGPGDVRQVADQLHRRGGQGIESAAVRGQPLPDLREPAARGSPIERTTLGETSPATARARLQAGGRGFGRGAVGGGALRNEKGRAGCAGRQRTGTRGGSTHDMHRMARLILATGNGGEARQGWRRSCARLRHRGLIAHHLTSALAGRIPTAV